MEHNRTLTGQRHPLWRAEGTADLNDGNVYIVLTGRLVAC